VHVSAGRIKSISAKAPKVAKGTRVIDLKGKVLMPGLCDGHVHVTAVTPDFAALARYSPFYTAARSAEILESMLMRGFTTVRDAGGADYGLALAVEEGHIRGPRLLFCGKALSQTGGHGDVRSPGENFSFDGCFCCPGLGRIVDGVDEMRRAARDEIRKGATQIKLMVSGGVSSPTDRVDSTQFSTDEIVAAVEEAEAANIHVMAHAYTARAVNRAIDCGVRSIEHGNLIDESSIALFAEHDAFYVPTLSTYQALSQEGVEAGFPPELIGKLDDVLSAGARALEMAYAAGVKMVYGTDLLGDMHRHQLGEFSLRASIIPAADLIRSATCTAAQLFGMEGEIGTVSAGARADLLVLDRNPLRNITVLENPEKHLKAVMKDGIFYSDRL
jgi:imidazolonepropionase-like amidohydrolase